jgi:hypothetical protein
MGPHPIGWRSLSGRYQRCVSRLVGSDPPDLGSRGQRLEYFRSFHSLRVKRFLTPSRFSGKGMLSPIVDLGSVPAKDSERRMPNVKDIWRLALAIIGLVASPFFSLLSFRRSSPRHRFHTFRHCPDQRSCRIAWWKPSADGFETWESELGACEEVWPGCTA